MTTALARADVGPTSAAAAPEARERLARALAHVETRLATTTPVAGAAGALDAPLRTFLETLRVGTRLRRSRAHSGRLQELLR